MKAVSLCCVADELRVGSKFKIQSSKFKMLLSRLSQAQLNSLSTCPRKFQHLYLDQMGAPVSWEQQERMLWGNRFHRLMQQRELGVLSMAEPSDPEEAELWRSLSNFVQTVPDVFVTQDTEVRLSEFRRSLLFQTYLLTVIYDLVILSPERAQILDWKTYPRPPKAEWLRQDWQTRLYPFVLVESSGYAPEQVSMTYWFVRDRHDSADHRATPQSLHFSYSADLHAQTHADLIQILQQLDQWLLAYEQGVELPQVSITKGRCDTCAFVTKCGRDGSQQERARILEIAEIEEVQV
jgi:hypothetical protein